MHKLLYNIDARDGEKVQTRQTQTGDLPDFVVGDRSHTKKKIKGDIMVVDK